MQELIFGAIIAAIIGAIPTAAVWAYRRYSQRVRAIPRDVSRAVQTGRDTIRERRQIADAAASGDVIAVGAVGMNPTRVIWAGAADQTTFHYRDLRAYKRDMQDRRVPYRRTFCCGRAPKVGTRRKA